MTPVTTTTEGTAIETVIPDLRDIPVDRLDEFAGSVLAHAIDEYRQRMKANGVPLSSFQARI